MAELLHTQDGLLCTIIAAAAFAAVNTCLSALLPVVPEGRDGKAVEVVNKVVWDACAEVGVTGSTAESLLEAVQSSHSVLSAASCDDGAAVIWRAEGLDTRGIAAALRAAGSGLGTLPIALACNNPMCCSLAKPYERQLVGERGCVCPFCKMARYCGQDCQRAHWKTHEQVCRLAIDARLRREARQAHQQQQQQQQQQGQ
jgi:hypothetical protein